MAKRNNNDVPRVDKTGRNQAKKVPVPGPGVGNPGSMPFGPGAVSTNSHNDSVTTGKPGINKGRRK